jgi:hypothetical protein
MEGKTLRIFYSSKELAAMLDISYATFRRMCSSEVCIGRNKYKRWNRKQVIELFRTVGFPAGYEHYEQTEV